MSPSVLSARYLRACGGSAGRGDGRATAEQLTCAVVSTGTLLGHSAGGSLNSLGGGRGGGGRCHQAVQAQVLRDDMTAVYAS